MSRINQFLRSLAVILPVLALCSVSSEILAWEADKLAPWVGNDAQGKKCGGTQVSYGPFNYLHRNQLKDKLQVVEESHFSAEVESLQKGLTTTAIGDIAYVILTWPNHHRALYSAYRYRLAHRGPWSTGNASPAECYLQRAIKFSPNELVLYRMHAVLMHKLKGYNKALTSYRAALRLQPNDLVMQYNMGLVLVALKKFEEAAQVAKVVYAHDFPLTALKNKLMYSGHWPKEPVEVGQDTTTPEELLQAEKPNEEMVSAEAKTSEDSAPDKAVQGEGVPEAEPKIAASELTASDLAARGKAVLEKEAQKTITPQGSAPEESASAGDERVDMSVVSQ